MHTQLLLGKISSRMIAISSTAIVKHTAINARMKWMGMMTKSDCYDLAYKFYHAKWNLVRRGYHFLHKLISKDD